MYLFVIFLVLSAGIIASGTLYYAHQKQSIKKDKQEELNAIAELKINQLTAWRNERIADTMSAYSNTMLRRSLTLFLKGNTSIELRKDITSWLESQHANYKYSEVSVFSADERHRLSVPETYVPLCPLVKNIISKGLSPGKITFIDFYRCAPSNPVRMGMIIMIPKDPLKDASPLGYILLEIDPEVSVYPLVESWPTPSRTAETYIVRREGNDVVYLNDLRQQKNTALTYRLPISRPNLPAAMAMRGKEGIVEGIDYRGRAVLAALKKIPDTPWFMVAKVDQAEIYATIRRTALMITITFSLMIITVGTLIGIWYRGRQAEAYCRQLALEEEKKDLELQLIQSQKMEALGILAGGIAHDFKNVLQPILINTEMISDVIPQGTQEREYLDQIIDAIQLGKNLVSQIKLFSPGKKSLYKPIYIGPVVQEALTFLKRSMPHDIKLKQWVTAKDNLVRADATQIYQLVLNLCMNAIQAMGPDNGFLGVSLKEKEITENIPARVSDLKPGRYMKLTIRDTGSGIKPEIMDKIFDPFFTTKKEDKGTGLGLAIVYSVVKNVQGSIIIRSIVGKGTRFEIFIPVHLDSLN
jgi:signal transduction histidine kinase